MAGRDEGQKTCENPGAFCYTWPGQNQAVACAEHDLQLRGVANAIGMHLQMIPIAMGNTALLPMCSQKVSEGKP